MGFYIRTPHNQHKAEQICVQFGGIPIERPGSFAEVPADKRLVCVVCNGPFDAAALCYDEREFEDFRETPGDCRPRQWLLMDKKLADEMAGYKEVKP